MPTYEYECQKCGQVFELFQSIKDPPRKTCIKPKCRGRAKRLLGTGAGLLFRGSGFYITDYRKPSYKEAAKKETASSTPTTTTTASSKTSSSGTSAKSGKD